MKCYEEIKVDLLSNCPVAWSKEDTRLHLKSTYAKLLKYFQRSETRDCEQDRLPVHLCHGNKEIRFKAKLKFLTSCKRIDKLEDQNQDRLSWNLSNLASKGRHKKCLSLRQVKPFEILQMKWDTRLLLTRNTCPIFPLKEDPKKLSFGGELNLLKSCKRRHWDYYWLTCPILPLKEHTKRWSWRS